MQRSSSADANKVSKRKGTRSVSTLTAAQLARKRANDREAQRAIRARTKDHIERLEAELDELRSVHSRDQTVQELLRRNKMLEEELKALRDTMGIPSSASFHNSSPYSTPGALASPRTSPYPAGDFTSASSAPLPDYAPAAQGFVPFAGQHAAPPSESWAASVPSNVSSPCSSATDDFGAGPAYLPTSAPNPNAMVPSPAAAGLRPEDIKMEYEDGNDHGFHLERSNSSGSSHVGNSMGQGFMLPTQTPAWPPHNVYYSMPVY